MAKKKDPSLDTFYWFSRSQSPLPISRWNFSEKGVFGRVLPAEMGRKGGSFGVASSGSIVLQLMIEKDNALLGTIPLVGPSQSPLPIDGKMTRKARRFEEREGETRTKNRSSGIATTGSIVLQTMMEEIDPSPATIHSPYLLLLPLPTVEGENAVFAVFGRLKSP